MKSLSALDRSGFVFPGGKSKALVMSFDDGLRQDEELVSLLNVHGIVGTFNLNSGFLGRDYYVAPERVKALYAGHEVAAHSIHHPDFGCPEWADAERLQDEVGGDRDVLAALAGKPVRSFAYPFGNYNTDLLEVLSRMGIVAARTAPSDRIPDIGDTHDLHYLPDNPLVWRPTCHIRNASGMVDEFLNYDRQEAVLLQLWGHSWEMDNGVPGSWGRMESPPFPLAAMDALCGRLGGHEDVWYAGFAEVARYLLALTSLEYSNCDTVYNPSGEVAVWLRRGGQLKEIPSNARVGFCG